MDPKKNISKKEGTIHRIRELFLPPVKGSQNLTTSLQLVQRLDYFLLILLIFCVAVVPLIVYLKVIPLEGVHRSAWTGSDEHMDFFNWWKAAALILSMFLLTVTHLVRRMASHEKQEMPHLFLPLLLYLMFAFLSTVSSEVPEISFGGFADREEGMWVLLAYGMLTYTAFHLTRNANRVRWILGAIFIGTAVMATLGLFQFLGNDFFQTDLGKKLILPKIFEQYMQYVTFNFGNNIMYATVYNPNYLGSYTALLLPVAVAMTLIWARERSVAYWLGMLGVLSLFVLWLGSMSRAGLLGWVAAVLVFLLLQFKTILRQWLPVLGMLCIMAIAYFSMNSLSDGLVAEEFLRTLPTSVQIALGRTPEEESVLGTGLGAVSGAFLDDNGNATDASQVGNPRFVKEVSLRDNRFRFATGTETLEIVLDKSQETTFRCYDANSSLLKLTGGDGQDGERTFLDPRYAAYSLTIKGNQFLMIWEEYQFLLSNEKGVLTYAPKLNTQWTEIAEVPRFGFERRERFASGRGWIWARTFPMLGKTLFTGYGPDTYAVYFPQHDVAGKINVFHSANILVDNPHNWYLQTAVNTGVISLLLLLWLLSYFFLDSVRARFGFRVQGMEPLFTGPIHGGGEETNPGRRATDSRNGKTTGGTEMISDKTNTQTHWLLLSGMMCGIVGYTVTGMFNDSVVSVAPVFWCLLGLGIGLLRDAPRRVVDTVKKDQPTP